MLISKGYCSINTHRQKNFIKCTSWKTYLDKNRASKVLKGTINRWICSTSVSKPNFLLMINTDRKSREFIFSPVLQESALSSSPFVVPVSCLILQTDPQTEMWLWYTKISVTWVKRIGRDHGGCEDLPADVADRWVLSTKIYLVFAWNSSHLWPH